MILSSYRNFLLTRVMFYLFLWLCVSLCQQLYRYKRILPFYKWSLLADLLTNCCWLFSFFLSNIYLGNRPKVIQYRRKENERAATRFWFLAKIREKKILHRIFKKTLFNKSCVSLFHSISSLVIIKVNLTKLIYPKMATLIPEAIWTSLNTI